MQSEENPSVQQQVQGKAAGGRLGLGQPRGGSSRWEAQSLTHQGAQPRPSLPRGHFPRSLPLTHGSAACSAGCAWAAAHTRTHTQAPCSICSPFLPAPPGPCALACECLSPAELAMESYLLLLRSRFQLNQPKQRLSVTSQLGIHPRGATASSAFTVSPSLMAAAVATAKNSHYDKAV